jgi:hypothetical protein
MTERTNKKQVDNITITCFSKEGKDFLDLIQSEYAKFSGGKDISDINGYSLGYWLVRYSGLVEPSEKACGLLRTTLMDDSK